MPFQPDTGSTQGGSPSAAWGRSAAAATTVDAGLRAHMLRVYNWMASGLLLTGIVALAVATIPGLQQMFYTAVPAAGGRVVMEPTLLFWVAAVSPLAFVLVLSFGYQRLSRGSMQAVFWVFAACMGASLSNLAFRYTGASIAVTFFVSAGMYAGVSLYGYTTRSDLTRLGGFLAMGVIGLLLACVVNIFLQSSALQFALSIAGVAVFLGLTAFETQQIRSDYLEVAYSGNTEEADKRGLMSALGLYLNFINIFQFMMQLMGVRRD